jgi:hypothetical protein
LRSVKGAGVKNANKQVILRQRHPVDEEISQFLEWLSATIFAFPLKRFSCTIAHKIIARAEPKR